MSFATIVAEPSNTWMPTPTLALPKRVPVNVFPDTVAFPVARCSAVRMFWNVLPLIVGEPDVIEETPNWASVSPGMSVNTLFVTR